MEATLIVIGGLLAAALGAVVTDRLKRARPQVIPTSIRRTIDVIPHGSVVSPNSDLLTSCSEHPFLETPSFEGIGRVDEREYVDFLRRTQERAIDYVRLQLPAVAERAQQVQAKLAADDFDGVAHIWIDSRLLWNYAEGAYVRREFTLPMNQHGATTGNSAEVRATDQESDQNRSPDELVELNSAPDGTYYVIYPRIVQAIVFPAKDRMGRGQVRSRELARRMAEAFARREKADLVTVFNFLAAIEHDVPALEAIIQQIDAELMRLTRLSITAVIGNTGGTPVSISKQTCEVELMLDGYTYKIADDNRAKPRQRSGDISLEMLLTDDGGNPIQPLAIEAGGLRPVMAVYPTPLSKEGLPDGGTLYDLLSTALEGAERGWRLKIDAVLQREASRAITSQKISFRDVQSSEGQFASRAASENQRMVTELRQALGAREMELSGARAELSAARAELSKTNAELEQATMQAAHWYNEYGALQRTTPPSTSGPIREPIQLEESGPSMPNAGRDELG
jgi:hypothetical protein